MGELQKSRQPCALSPMQEGMLFQYVLHRTSSDAGYDLEQIHLRSPERLDLATFARAWGLVVDRHEALRSSFQWEGVPSPVQHVAPALTVPLEEHHWQSLGLDELEVERAQLLERDRARGFDLDRPPLLRVAVLHTSEGDEVLWSVHHIVLDGRAIPIVLVEVFHAYAELLAGRVPTFEPVGPSPSEYASWLRARDVCAALTHFEKLLSGKTSPTPLPGAEPLSRALPEGGTGTVRQLIAPEVRDALRATAAATGTSIGTLVLAAWALTLSRLTGDDDVLFGVTRSMRRAALEGRAREAVGVLINTLPMRVSLGDDDTVHALLTRLRLQSRSLDEHLHVPLVSVQQRSNLPPGTPLFETLVMFDNRELNASLRRADPSWAERSCTLHERPSPPLTITAFDDETVRGLELRVLFERRRFRRVTVERLTAMLAQALAELSAGPHRRLGELDVLTPEERRRLLTEWNDTRAPFSDQLLLHEGFERRADAQPAALAVEQDSLALTYAELEARANRLAWELRHRGARPGVFIGLALDRTPELVVALLAIAKSGAAYVPLDPAHPVERLSFMLQDAKALLVVTQARFLDRFSTPALVVDGVDRDAIARQPSTRPPRVGAPTDRCYAIFTSGSTGTPKGVVLTHRAVVNTFEWVTRTFAVGPSDRLLFVTSPCFDLSVYDTFGALAAGATVVVASAAQLEDPQQLAALVVDARITVWDSAPAALLRLTTFFPRTARTAPLRLVMLSGDWIPVALPGLVTGLFPAARVMSLGGATEAAIWSNWFPIKTVDPAWSSIPYGKPIQNARYYVLDRRLQPVPIGVTGDLYIAGTCLAEGYLERPALTEERFLTAPFECTEGPERLYKTGDLARYFDDGNLEFLGRSDFQVKIRGFRVELGEVESVLTAFPDVREATCSAVSDASGQKSLVAYVVPREGRAVDRDALKAHVAKRVPDYMVPTHLVVLDALPLSSNGKVDRKALPSPQASAVAVAVEPRTDRERALASLWREVLGVPQVGVTDNFFALGGHSLLAVMLVNRIQERLGATLSLASVLQHPTIEGLATLVQGTPEPQATAKHLVTVGRSDPDAAHLVLVPGIGGLGYMFEGLARRLGRRYSVHVLNAVGINDEREGFDHDIEELAAIYEPQVLAACPDQPIIIGGYSFGVLVAFELAVRLLARGRRVPLMVSFDGFAPGYPRRLPPVERLRAHVNALLFEGPNARREYLRTRARRLRQRVYTRLGRPEVALDHPGVDPKTDERLRKLSAALWGARDRYHPSHTLHTDLLLLKTLESQAWIGIRFDDPLYGWREHLDGRIRVTAMPGEHLTLFDERNVQLMADAIVGELADPDATNRGPTPE